MDQLMMERRSSKAGVPTRSEWQGRNKAVHPVDRCFKCCTSVETVVLARVSRFLWIQSVECDIAIPIRNVQPTIAGAIVQFRRSDHKNGVEDEFPEQLRA